MVKRRQAIAAGLAACVLVVVGVAVLKRSAGPEYDGHALPYWLTRLNSEDSGESARAYAAVERIGAHSLPTIRRLLSLRDNPAKRVVRRITVWLPFGLEVRGPEYWRFRARLALAIIGSDTSKHLLPECQRMLKDPDPRVREDAVETLG